MVTVDSATAANAATTDTATTEVRTAAAAS